MDDPGRMDKRVTLRSMTRTSDGGGGFTETAVALATMWAHVEPLDGDERLEAMQTGMRRPHRFTVRYREGVTGATSLLYGLRPFDIVSIVDPDEHHDMLVILADEIVLT